MPDIAICNAKPKPSNSHSWLCEWLFLGWTKSLCLKNRLCYTRGDRETRNPYSSASSLPVFSRAAHVTDALLYYSRDEAQTSAFFLASKKTTYIIYVWLNCLAGCCLQQQFTKPNPSPIDRIHNRPNELKRDNFRNTKSLFWKNRLCYTWTEKEKLFEPHLLFPCGHCRIVMTLNNMSDFMQQYIHCKELLILVDTLSVYSDLQWTIEHHVHFFRLLFYNSKNKCTFLLFWILMHEKSFFTYGFLNDFEKRRFPWYNGALCETRMTFLSIINRALVRSEFFLLQIFLP